MTSNAALQRVRRLYHADKAGHTGSLDPLATGLLPICLGQATKLSGYLLDADKRYRVRAAVGARTDTADAEGRVVRQSDPSGLSREALEAVLPRFTGDILQKPPMYSALKRGGRPLYELARAGETVELEARPVRIRSLELLDFGPGFFELDVRCGKGTYIRSLVEDLAAAVGQCAHVAVLRRLEAGPFRADRMITAAAVEAAAEQGEAVLDTLLIEPLEGLAGWPRAGVGAEQAARLGQGQALRPEGPALAPGPVAVVDGGGHLIGVAEADERGVLHPKRWLA